jgi:hypothetical protein
MNQYTNQRPPIPFTAVRSSAASGGVADPDAQGLGSFRLWPLIAGRQTPAGRPLNFAVSIQSGTFVFGSRGATVLTGQRALRQRAGLSEKHPHDKSDCDNVFHNGSFGRSKGAAIGRSAGPFEGRSDTHLEARLFDRGRSVFDGYRRAFVLAAGGNRDLGAAIRHRPERRRSGDSTQRRASAKHRSRRIPGAVAKILPTAGIKWRDRDGRCLFSRGKRGPIGLRPWTWSIDLLPQRRRGLDSGNLVRTVRLVRNDAL